VGSDGDKKADERPACLDGGQIVDRVGKDKDNAAIPTAAEPTTAAIPQI
jgi:hypothetical protein